jgi:hypothetical protein
VATRAYPTQQRLHNRSDAHPILGRMRRYMIWFILAIFWGAIALVGQFRHHPGNAALEGAVAVLFIVIGVAVKRRDAAAAARYTANRPK